MGGEAKMMTCITGILTAVTCLLAVFLNIWFKSGLKIFSRLAFSSFAALLAVSHINYLISGMIWSFAVGYVVMFFIVRSGMLYLEVECCI